MDSLLGVFFLMLIIQNEAKNPIDYMKDVVDPNAYILLPPGSVSKEATEVRVGIYANSIEIDDRMDMAMNMYVRHGWKDERLQFQSADYDGSDELTLPDEAWKKIWIPDIFFRNEKQVTRLHDTGRENVLMRVNSTGHLWFVIKLTAKLSCPMHLQKYPFDTQSCPIMLESFRYNVDTMYFSWLDKPIDIDPSVTLRGFQLVDHLTYDCSQNYTAGMFPCLEIRLLLSRDAGNFALKLFLPSVLLVIISWFSLWMNTDRYPERIGILLVLILMLMIQYGMLASNVIQVPYVKCMDIWIIMCILFVFAAMLEATLVKAIGTKSSSESDEGRLHCPTLARGFDVGARILFPVVFVLFLIIFFAIYN